MRYYTVDEIQGCRSIHNGMKTCSGKCSSTIFNVHLFLLSQPSQSRELKSLQSAQWLVSTAFFPLPDRCPPASSPIDVRPLIYNPEPNEQSLLRPDHHLAFGINLEGNVLPRVNGPPHLGVCCAGGRKRQCFCMRQPAGAHIWKIWSQGHLNHAESSCMKQVIN